MQISEQQRGDVLELSIKGRLDNYWSEFLAQRLNTAVNDGALHLRLDLSDVNFLSSAGIGILMRVYRQLRAIHGTFVIDKASERVRSTLKLVALEPILFGDGKQAIAASATTAPNNTIETECGTVEVYNLSPTARMECRLINSPSVVKRGNISAETCQTRQLSDSHLALGIGALGADYDDCRCRFGEFVALGGCCAHLPTDGASVPDYLVSAEEFVPEIHVLYGIECHGMPTQFLRFDSRRDVRWTLFEIVRQSLNISGSTTIAIAMIAEASRVVGAALRSSPAAVPTELDFPKIRECISFAPEITGTRSTVAAAGIVSSDAWPEVLPFLRPLDPDSAIRGHFHAALFPYRPIQRGLLELPATAHNAFQSQVVTSVLHLLNDQRPINGAGDTTLVRGACWIGRLNFHPDGNI
ncbi:MAG TPA: STAS domain-containing protein [Terriglobales bacterium]|nr:STAS domain-containing protein [Terriglobales bacterium]